MWMTWIVKQLQRIFLCRKTFNMKFKDRKWVRKITLWLNLRKYDIDDNWADSNPSTTEMLDKVLDYLYQHQNDTHGYSGIEEGLTGSNISLPNIHRILDFLTDDGFVTEIEPSKVQIQPIKFKINVAEGTSYNGSAENSSRSVSSFFISVKGIKFHQRGGYRADKKRFWKKEKNIDYFFKLLTACLTVASIYFSVKAGQFKERVTSLEKRNSIIESQILQLQKISPVQQTFYILPDTAIIKPFNTGKK